MKIDNTTLLFFDASCLIAAAGSPTGGSGFLLSLCSRGFLRGAVSQPVLLEAQRNILTKLGSEALHRFYRLLVFTPFTLASIPPPDQLMIYKTLVNSKDAHVLAAANAVKAAYIVTLDKGLARQVNASGISIRAITPGEFIKNILPTHVDYPPE